MATIPARRLQRDASAGLLRRLDLGDRRLDLVETENGERILPILDGAKSVQLTPPDLAEVVGDWFLQQADPTGRVWLWTGTFDTRRLGQAPGRVRRDYVGRRGAVDALTDWHRTLLAQAPSADSLVGIEAHKSGARHAHALVVTQPDFKYRQVAGHWFAEHGYNRWEQVERANAAARYAAKYVGKELGVWDAALGGGRLQL